MICFNCGGEQFSDKNGIKVCACCGEPFAVGAIGRAAGFPAPQCGKFDENKRLRLKERFYNLLLAVQAKPSYGYIYSRAVSVAEIDPRNFLAQFYKTACSIPADDRAVCSFLDSIDVETYACYVPDVINFLCGKLSARVLASLNGLVYRAYAAKDGAAYCNFMEKLCAESVKADRNVYDAGLKRDIFIAHSGNADDLTRAVRLVNYLEERGYSCFLDVRNLPYGAKDGEARIKTAAKNCSVFLLVSSYASREEVRLKTLLGYIEDENCSSGGKDGADVSSAKPAIEYRTDGFGGGTESDEYIKSIFGSRSRATTHEEVAALLEEFAGGLGEVKGFGADGGRSGKKRRSRKKDKNRGKGGRRLTEFRRGTLVALLCVLVAAVIAAVSASLIIMNNRISVYGYDGFSCEEDGDGITVTGYKNPDVSGLILPAEIDGKPVTGISEYAFSGFTKLQYLYIPATVEKIGYGAFADCENISEASLPAWATYSVPKSKLVTVCINGGASVGPAAFEGCALLETVTMADGIINIGERAFNGCSALTSLYIPESAAYVGEDAFAGCENIAEAVIPAFAAEYISNTNLVNLCITGTGVIGNDVFAECYKLETVTVADGVTSVGERAFSNCINLRKLSIADTVTEMGCDMIFGCGSLEELTLPFVGFYETTQSYQGITRYCYPLGYLFGSSSYDGCEMVNMYFESINYGTDTAYTNFRTYYIPTSLRKVTVTSGEVCAGAFSNCTNIAEFALGRAVKSIGGRAFYGLGGIVIDYDGTAVMFASICAGGGNHEWNDGLEGCTVNTVTGVIVV